MRARCAPDRFGATLLRVGLNKALGIKMYPGKIVKRGTFLYDGTVQCGLCISLSTVRYGTGDYEDEPDVANDVETDTYYLWFDSPAAETRFNSGGGAYSSLSEAVAAAERFPGIGSTVQWAQQAVATDRPKTGSG